MEDVYKLQVTISRNILAQLDMLAQILGVRRAAVVSMLVDAECRRRGICVDASRD